MGDMMDRYNNGSSIPLEEVDDIEEAIEHWAEGSTSLKKLLETCILKEGIETNGCHYGINPYLDFSVNDKHDIVAPLLTASAPNKKTQFLIMPDGGNPFSGALWYKPSLSLNLLTDSKEETNDMFDFWRDTIERHHIDSPLSFGNTLLAYYDFFAGKESRTLLRYRNPENEDPCFRLELTGKNPDSSLSPLYQQAGFSLNEEYSREDFQVFEISAKTPELLAQKMHSSLEVIQKGWSLELPTEEKEDMSIHERALFKKREWGDSEEGKALFNEWLQKEWEKEMSKMERPPLSEMQRYLISMYRIWSIDLSNIRKGYQKLCQFLEKGITPLPEKDNTPFSSKKEFHPSDDSR